MLVDLHMHEATHSPDSTLRLEDMVAAAQHLGLDAICITDHDSMGLRARAQGYAGRTGFPVFVGVEYYSLEGDIVAFGLDEVPQKRLHAQDFVNLVHAQGGVCFAAHPFRSNNRGLAHHLETVQGLHGIEAFNASTSLAANQKALACCRRLGLQPLGASDCHEMNKLGVYATLLPGHAATLPAFIRLLKEGGGRPMGYLESRYVDLCSTTALLEPETALLPPEAHIRPS